MNQNLAKMIVLIVGTFAILTFFFTELLIIRSNYEADLSISKACINNGGTLLLEFKNPSHLTSATCKED